MDLTPIYTFTEQQVWAIAGAFILMLFDMVSGIIQAVMNREFRSSTMRTGLGHKAVLALIILLAICIEILSAHVAGLGFGGVTIYVVCVAIIIMEVASIMENLCKAYPELADLPVMKIFEHAEADAVNPKTVANEVYKRG
ncbi:phage holin family protein [Collinsella sp. CLA-ER-H7]|uniref:phage holin family protein n=1 Tax=Collinsella sp. CLA-ER-H7 TaxID=3136230 RepID=UPI0032C19DE2